MDDIKKMIAANRLPIFIGLGAVLFILAAFCPVIDVMGKAKLNGFKLLFDGTGVGISRFWIALMILMPLGVIASAVVDSLKNLTKIFMIVALVMSFLYMICLPQGCSTAFGSILYIVIAIIGTVASFIADQK